MTARRKPGLDRITATRVKLDAVSGRLASEPAPPIEAAAELRAIADGCTDLLAQVAGSILGRFLARPGLTRPDALLAVAYLVMAGADRHETLTDAVEDTRKRAAAPTHHAGW